MKKTIYLLRHGETLFNTQHKIQGWCDSPLTQKGIKQAEIASQWFKNEGITFDSAYCSTSERASDTLEIITGSTIKYQRLKGLKEWNFGAFEGKDECLNPVLPYGDFFEYYGGEKEKDFQKRIVSTIINIAKNDSSQSILIVSHGAACAQFCRYWEKYNIVQYQRGIKNCSIMEFSYENDIFSCQKITVHDFSSL